MKRVIAVLSNEENNTVSPKKLDIRGRVCPMTFVYTKLALEELETGRMLEVLLDFRPAIKSIPDNCVRQGLAEVIEIQEIDSKEQVWLLKLRRI